MPIDEMTVTAIACDNPACPGPPATLSRNDRRGWLIVTAERYGEAVVQHVYCTHTCAAAGLTEQGDRLEAERLEATAIAAAQTGDVIA